MEKTVKKVPLFVSHRRWFGLSGEKPLLRCLTCGGPLGSVETLDLGDFFYRHSPCGQIYDVKPLNVFRSPAPPTHKIISHVRPDGRVVRRRVPLGDIDLQLDLFGGVL